MSDTTSTGPGALPPVGRSGGYPPELPPREGKPVSFYLAIFLALLLLASGALNVVLLVFNLFGSAAGLGATIDDGMYDIVAVGGDPEAPRRLLRIQITGAIAEAGSPLIGAAGGTVTAVERGLRLAAKDDRIRGVLLEVDSPGGGVTDSDVIWQSIIDFKNTSQKPVVALFGDMAASGGYYVAAACDRIIARPTSITGSIGVILSNFNFAEAARELGVQQENIISQHTPYKDIMSPFRPMEAAEREILTSIVEEMYQRFVDVVERGRPKLSRARVVELADGRIYSAKQALEHGLIDEIGGTDEAIAVLNGLAELDSSQLVEQRRRPTLFDALFGVSAKTPSAGDRLAALLTSSTGPRLLYYWQGAR